MGLFGRNIKFGDVIAGAADAINEQLKEDIKRTKTFADDIQMYHIKRRQEKAEKLEENKEEIEDVLNNLASFVDGNKMSEGMNKYDYAAQLFAQAGTVDQANNLITTLSDARNKGFDIRGVIDYAQTETGGFGLADYVNKFVKRPSDVIKISDKAVEGVGLYKAFKPQNIGDDIRKAVELAAPTTKDEIPDFLVPKATIKYAKLPGSQEYADKKKATDLAIENASLQNQKLKFDMNMKDALTNSGLRSQGSDIRVDLKATYKIALDNNNQLDIKTSKEQGADLRGFQTAYVKQLTQRAFTAKGTLNNKANIATIVGAASLKDPNTGNYFIKIVPPNDVPEKMSDLQIGTVYDLEQVDANGNVIAKGPHIHIGNGQNIPLYDISPI
jgi:hypothetical protein